MILEKACVHERHEKTRKNSDENIGSSVMNSLQFHFVPFVIFVDEKRFLG